jgi:hypothetical protein
MVFIKKYGGKIMLCPGCSKKGRNVEMDIETSENGREVKVTGHICPECNYFVASGFNPRDTISSGAKGWGCLPGPSYTLPYKMD